MNPLTFFQYIQIKRSDDMMLIYIIYDLIFQLGFWWYLPYYLFHTVDISFLDLHQSFYGPLSSLYPWTFPATTGVSWWFHLLLRLVWRLTLHSTCCGNAFARVCSCTAVNQQSYLEKNKLVTFRLVRWWSFQDIEVVVWTLLFSLLLGEMSLSDEHFFQMGWNHQLDILRWWWDGDFFFFRSY